MKPLTKEEARFLRQMRLWAILHHPGENWQKVPRCSICKDLEKCKRKEIRFSTPTREIKNFRIGHYGDWTEWVFVGCSELFSKPNMIKKQ